MQQSYDTLQRRWKNLRSRGDVTVREVACGMGARTLLCAEAGHYDAPAVTISAGIHGDEPAGPWALLGLVEDRQLDARFSYRLWACTNPSGFDAGTRESAEGVDLNRTFGRGGSAPESRAIITANRDRNFELAIDLHEDDTCEGFYCYEYGESGLGERVAEAVQSSGYALHDPPVLRPNAEDEIKEIGGLSYSLALARRAAKAVLTLESPRCLALEERVAILRLAVKAALAALANP